MHLIEQKKAAIFPPSAPSPFPPVSNIDYDDGDDVYYYCYYYNYEVLLGLILLLRHFSLVWKAREDARKDERIIVKIRASEKKNQHKSRMR